MEVNRIFKVNRRLNLGVAKKEAGGEEVIVYYPSRIEMVRDDEIWIAAPQEKGVLVPVAIGEELDVYVVGENEVFRFRSSVKNRTKKGSIAYVVLPMPPAVTREQRRDYVRFTVALPVLFKKGEKTLEGVTKNISGGGMLIHLAKGKDAFDSREEVVFCLIMNGGDIMGKAEVVRQDAPDVYAFRFTSISDKDREEIIKYIFKQQVELRKRGLLKR